MSEASEAANKSPWPWNFFSVAGALKAAGCNAYWQVAYDTCIQMPLLPHRTYIYSDRDGFHYEPMILQWNLWGRVIWQDNREIARQRAAAR